MALATENPDVRLSSFLVAGGHLGAQQAADLIADSNRTGISLVNRLLAGHIISQQVLAQGLASCAGLKFVPPSHLKPAPRALDLLTAEQALEIGGLPLMVDPAQAVVAFALPPSTQQLGQVRALVGRPVLPVIAEIDALRRAIQMAYHGISEPEPLQEVSNGRSRPPGSGADVNHIDELLECLLDMKGSDLHLAAGAKPTVRIQGDLRPIDQFGRLDSDKIKKLLYDILSEKQIAAYEHEFELDAAYSIPSRSRFRMNVFRQRGSVGAVLRVIPFDIPPFDGLGLPPAVRRLADLPRGLVLVTGPTGSGKSTTLASLIDIINRTKAVHIMTCEDPIEFLHTHQRAIVNQREVGQDTMSFASALRRVLREDPDVILVGEMRDLETIQMALTAAETGHLVFGTLHTQSAPQTVDRMVDVFPPEQQGQVRVMLGTTLQAVVTQQLLAGKDGAGRVAAVEVLVVTPAVRNLIREGKGHQIPTQMQAGAKHGMVTMDQSLATLVKAGRVSYELAAERAGNPDVLRDLVGLPREKTWERAVTTTYTYKVRDQAGRLVEGSLEAQNEQLVVTKLREMGYVPLRVSAKGRSKMSMEINIGRSKVSLKDVAVFSRQLATMLESGLSILRGLSILAEQTESKAFVKVIGEMRLDIERGLSLSQAVGRHPKVFPPVYLAMIRAGETGGMLDDVMLSLADTLEKQMELRGKIKSAMTYPIAVFCIVVLILSAMLIFIVPMFESMYHDLGGTLPLPTRVLITASGLITGLWWLIVIIIVASIIAFRRVVSTPGGRLAFDQFKLKLPVFGVLMQKTAITRFARTLASLIHAGVPIMESFDIVGETAGNAVVSNAVVNARERVRLGESVSASLADATVFPPMVVQMIAVGEETGALDSMLEKISDFYDREVESTVNSLTALIEPFLMVFMGFSVGGMVIALYMPMFQIINLVK